MDAPLHIVLPWPARVLWPNSRVHWAALARARKRQRMDAAWRAKAAGLRPLAALGLHVALQFNPPARRAFDLDNALAAMKGALDGIRSMTAAGRLPLRAARRKRAAACWCAFAGLPREAAVMQQLCLPGFDAPQRRARRRVAGDGARMRAWLQLALDFTRPAPLRCNVPSARRGATPAVPPSVFGWMAQQALHAAGCAAPPRAPKRRNTGMRRDSDTRRVLALIGSMPGTFLLHRQIRQRLALRKGALDWALHYLRRCGLVEAAPFQLPGCRRILRYRLAAR